jgi:tetratricopeptide (TPR) repeat protein
MTVDADDRLDTKAHAVIRQIVDQGYYDFAMCDVMNCYDAGNVHSRLTQQRIFKRCWEPNYQGYVHNQRHFAKEPPDGLRAVRAPITFFHLGYGMITPEKLKIKYERGLSMTKRYVEDHPEDGFAWMNYATAIRNTGLENGNKELMIEALNNAIEKAGDNQAHIKTQALNLLGWVYYLTGDRERAIRLGKQAVERKRNYLDALLLLGYAYADNQNDVLAERYLKEYLFESDRLTFSEFTDAVVLERVNQKAMAYKALAAIEEYRQQQKPTIVKD